MKKINWLLLLTIALFWAACSKDDVVGETTETSKELTFAQRTAGNNPYNVENMKLAYQYLVEQGRLTPEMFPDFHVRATNKYLKLKPATLEEEDQINADTTFIALDYPLDLDLPEDYTEKRPDLEEGQIPEYYTNIKINQNIGYTGQTELIEEMYVPEEDPYFKDADEDYRPGSERITTRAQLHDELLFTAYFFKGLEHLLAADMNEAKGVSIDDDKPQKPVLTNADNTLVLDGNNEKRFNDAIIKPLGIGKKWYPSGNLRYVDTSLPAGSQNQPLPGAQVLIRQVGITYHTAVTDANGHFQMGKLRGHARFYIQWERQKYNIKNKGLWQAEKKGPHQRSPWDHTIQPQHGEDIYHALIHVACLEFYYGNRFGITQPRNNIRIAARQSSSCTSNHVTIRKAIYDISVCEWGSSHNEIYGTTIHELAHSSHSQFDSKGYNELVRLGHIYPWLKWETEDYEDPIQYKFRSARRVLESYASTVELMFVQRRYSYNVNTQNTAADPSHLYRRLGQNLRLHYTTGSPLMDSFYTTVGFDMIDNYNQRVEIGNDNLPVDRVRGYTLPQIENGLKGAWDMTSWKNNIKNNTSNSTEVHLDELFANWDMH